MKIHKQKLVINMEERLSNFLNNIAFYVRDVWTLIALGVEIKFFEHWLENKIIKSSSLKTNRLGTAVGPFSMSYIVTFLLSFCLDNGSWLEGLRRNLSLGLRLIEVNSCLVKVPVILLQALYRPFKGHPRHLCKGGHQGPLRCLVRGSWGSSRGRDRVLVHEWLPLGQICRRGHE